MVAAKERIAIAVTMGSAKMDGVSATLVGWAQSAIKVHMHLGPFPPIIFRVRTNPGVKMGVIIRA